MVVRHDMSVNKIALREDPLTHGTQTFRLIRTHDPGPVPVLTDTDGDAVRLDGGLEVDQVVDEVVAIILVADRLGAELNTVEHVRRNVLVRAAGEDLEDRCGDLLPVFELGIWVKM